MAFAVHWFPRPFFRRGARRELGGVPDVRAGLFRADANAAVVKLYEPTIVARKLGGVPVLDLYEGMWHIFQVFHHQLPESKLARRKVRVFLEQQFASSPESRQ